MHGISYALFVREEWQHTRSRRTFRTNSSARLPKIISAAQVVSKGSLLSTHCCSKRVSNVLSMLVNCSENGLTAILYTFRP